jgi:hypothetical protein
MGLIVMCSGLCWLDAVGLLRRWSCMSSNIVAEMMIDMLDLLR